MGGYIFLDDTLSAAAPKGEKARKALLQLEPVERGDPVNVLLIGSDIRPQHGDASDNANSDSLILLRVDTRRGSISMLSFPRDLYVDIPGAGRNRINVAFSTGGAEMTMATVKQLTGEEINEYVILDFQGFERLVDKVGGVYIDVDRRYFNDNAGRGPTSSYEAIDLQAGYQRLNGHDALDYVRYRHTDDDFARIARQQRFLSEVKRQTKKLGNLRSLTDLRDIFVDNIETSIDDPRDAHLAAERRAQHRGRPDRAHLDQGRPDHALAAARAWSWPRTRRSPTRCRSGATRSSRATWPRGRPTPPPWTSPC